MKESYKFVIEIGSKNEGISLGELSMFLNALEYAYNRAYILSYPRLPNHNRLEFMNENEYLKTLDLFRSYTQSGLDFNADLDIEPLVFDRISTNSPLKIVGYSSAFAIFALSLTVSLAGGEVDLKNNTFKVNSLVDAGLKVYRELKAEKNMSPEHVIRTIK
ncbi:hypothetical protein ACVTEI_18850 [Vibrio cholerae]|uniref:hypothetical protein n=2 Tax=Vibrio cholerae TaxID=666 RepID=UPI0002C16F5D|nr:hypothetical protein [Vibrio cholerae]EMQ62393.1 hypothetical protein VCNHCC008D_003370 [Vibrio cholerae O1 str. NHCC-008D]